MTEFLDCPFCGGKASSSAFGAHVCCDDVDCAGGICRMSPEKWNRRAAQPQYLANCKHSVSQCESYGQCLGVDCSHAGMAIVKRVCVEPKQDGIFYPVKATKGV